MDSAARYDEVAREIRAPGRRAPGSVLDGRELVRLATLAASSHNTQPWTFRVEGASVDILPDFTRRCPVVDPRDAHLFRSLGCAAENLVHAAAAQGHGAEVEFHPATGGVRVHLEPSGAVRPGELYQAIPWRQCTKTAYDGTPLESHEVTLLEAAGRGPGVRTILLSGSDQLASVAEFVREGDLVQLKDPAFRRELRDWIRFNPGAALETRDGLAGRTNGQPAIPSWLGKRILRLVLRPGRQADTDVEHIRTSSAVAVLAAARDDEPAWVEVGRAYQRLALQATALGIRNAFINQPVEVPSLRPELDSWLGLEGESAGLLVRLGRAPLAPFSLRRPVEDVMITA